jgi:hypothetical protein
LKTLLIVATNPRLRHQDRDQWRAYQAQNYSLLGQNRGTTAMWVGEGTWGRLTVQTNQEPSSEKLFKIDDVSREIRTKKATIRDWEQQLHLRETHLAAPIKCYTESDIELFRQLKTLLVEEKLTPELALKRLPTNKPTATQPAKRIVTVEEDEEDEEEGEPLEIELEIDMDCKPTHTVSSVVETAPEELIESAPVLEQPIATFEPAHKPAELELTPACKTVTIPLEELNKIRAQALKIKEQLLSSTF